MSHLKRTVRIHAPLGTVYDLAHDPKRWSDWYVGLSDEMDVGVEGRPAEHRYLMVGAPFPLTQRVVEDKLGKKEAHWRSRAEAPPERYEVTRTCKLVMLAGDCEWTYKRDNGDTEVSVVLDFSLPTYLMDDPSDRSVIERIEAKCLEQSLENLRRLCEVSH